MHHTLSRRWFMHQLALYSASFLGSLSDAAESRTAPAERMDLLSWRKGDGTLQKIRSIPGWEKRRTEITRRMQEIMGPLPAAGKRCPLDPQIEEEVDCGKYLRQIVSYRSEPECRTPAYVCIPKSVLRANSRTQAILCLHPSDSQHGPKVVVGLGGKKNRQYAHELAQRGYVTIAPAYPLMGSYHPEWEKLGYASGSMKAIWDNIRALDYLESLAFVQPGRFGAIGHSLGGHNAVFTAVFDPRIKVIVSSCGLDSFLDYMDGDPAVWQLGKGWTSRFYMPKLAAYAGRLKDIPFDFHEVVAALAPRPCFISAPLGDKNFNWQSVAALTQAASAIYKLYQAPQALKVLHPESGHDFPHDVRTTAYRFLAENLPEAPHAKTPNGPE